MSIPCELLIKILGKVIPKIKNHYGCMATDCFNDPCTSEFNAVVNQILNLKGVNKQWKSVLEKFVIKKHLEQMLFLHEQIRNYLPYPRFVLHKNGSEPFQLGLHPFRSEEDDENEEWVYFIKSIILAPENASFGDIFICPANISEWLLQLIKELRNSNPNLKSHVRTLRIGSCGDHELPFLDSRSDQYRQLIQLHDAIKKVSEKPQDFFLKNPIYCIECKKLDFCEWNHCAPSIVFCSLCDEPIDLQVTCCACINLCSCWKTHYDYDIIPFLKNCGSFICKYCDEGHNYLSSSCPHRND